MNLFYGPVIFSIPWKGACISGGRVSATLCKKKSLRVRLKENLSKILLHKDAWRQYFKSFARFHFKTRFNRYLKRYFCLFIHWMRNNEFLDISILFLTRFHGCEWLISCFDIHTYFELVKFDIALFGFLRIWLIESEIIGYLNKVTLFFYVFIVFDYLLRVFLDDLDINCIR